MRICNRYPGANPRRASDVEKVAPDRFLVQPWSEDGDGNYKFCLNVEAVNDSGAPEPVTLLIDWDELDYMGFRDYVLVGRDREWRFVPGKVDGAVTAVEMEVPPGEWFVGLHPVYDLEMFESDRLKATAGGFESFTFGGSFEERGITGLSIGDPGAPAVMVVSRFHPYETAGSFCVSAMLEMLAGDYAGDGPLTSRFHFVVVPMPNPDGTASGCCKRSRSGGPDLCHEGADSDDPAGQALARLLADTRPSGYMDIHGWMHRDHDGFSFSHQDRRDAMVEQLASEPVFSKGWKGSDWSQREDLPGDFFMRATRDHGAVGAVVSPSWFGRSVEDMREFGRKFLRAFCRGL